MARYTATVESSAALAADTGFAWLRPTANGGGKLRRIIVGVRAGTGAPLSQQVVVGVARTTNAGTTPTAGTIHAMDPNSPTAASAFNTAYATPPTLESTDSLKIPLNTQSSADIPAELLEELVYAKGTTDGFAFVNRANALPSAHLLVFTVEFEE